MIEAVMRAAAAKTAFLPSRPPPWPPALPAEFLQETPEIAPPQARPTRVSNELTDGVLDLTCGDEPDAVPPPPPAALNLFAASPSQRLLGEVPCAGKRVRGGGAPPVSPARSAALAALRKRGGLCTMLDVLDQHIPPRQPGGKRGRRDETDEDGEFRHSLAEIHAEYRRATTDPALTWDPSGGGVAAGAPRIPRPAIFLRIASLYSALQSGFISKHCQLRAFDWMPEAAAAACIAVARTLISDLDEGAFEVPVACAAYEWSNEEQRLRPRAAEFAEQQSPKRARRLASGAAASPGVGGAARAVEGAPPLAAPPPHAAPQQPAAAAPEAGAGAAVAASPPSDDPAAAADAEGCRPVTVEGILDLGEWWW